jgi:hypothetical protein
VEAEYHHTNRARMMRATKPQTQDGTVRGAKPRATIYALSRAVLA